MTTIILLGTFALATISWQLVLSWRLAPFRKDLLEDSTGFERFRDFLRQPWGDNCRSRNYLEGGQRYLRHYRLALLVGIFALFGLWAAIAAYLQ